MKISFLSKILGRFTDASLTASDRILRRELLTTVDITHQPQAVGFLRDVQLADVVLLREVMRVAREIGVRPWLVGGGLFGVARHGGRFMPWDDDIDLGLMREDYQTFLEAFNAHCRPGFGAFYHYTGKYCRIKIRHADLPPKVDLSIFVFDRHWKALPTLAEKIAFRKDVDRVQNEVKRLWKRGISTEDHLKAFDEARRRILLGGRDAAPAEAKPAVFWGPELKVFESATSIVLDYDEMFPLVPAQFEGVDVWTPHDTAAFLTYVYGDWGRFPENFTCRHKASIFSVEKALSLRRFIRRMVESEE